MLTQYLSRRNLFLFFGAALLIALFAVQLLTSTAQQSITWDEDDHIFAGYMSWKHADFGLNPEHPPLLKLVATIPILQMPLHVPQLQDRNFKQEAFLSGKDFLFKNDADTILRRTRTAASIFAIALLIIAFIAANEMFGLSAGFVALTLLAFDPNFLAFGAMIATDTALSCTLFATIYALYRYVKHPGITRLLVTGLAAGLALATKHSAILLLPMVILLALGEVLRARQQHNGRNTALRLTSAIALMSVIAVVVLWAAYGFRFSARPAGLQLNPTFASYVPILSRAREVSLLSFVARWHLLPESYLYGLVDVRFMSDFYQTYLLGKPYPHGVWYYFPIVMLIKTTVGFMGLLVVTFIAIANRKLSISREVVFLSIPPIIYLLVAMTSGMNIGMRHILPMYPFLIVLAAAASCTLIRQHRAWAYVVGAFVLLHIASSARVYPDYIPYANEFWGGSSQTYKLLSDSNSDWGQQLKFTSRYLNDHGIKDCWFVYFAAGVVDPTYYGIPCKPLPTANTFWLNQQIDVPPTIDGPVLISAGNLSGFEFGPGPTLNPYDNFIRRRPSTVIHNAIFVYDGHYELPLAAALVHAQRAGNLIAQNKPEAALTEAQEAVRLAPDAVSPHATLGDVLIKLKRNDEARAEYQSALHLAKTIQPEFQIGWVSTLEQKLHQI